MSRLKLLGGLHFRPFPGAIRSRQIIDIPGKLLIVWDGLSGHRNRGVVRTTA